MKIVFLDRDGVLNVDTGYPHDPSALQLLPGVPEQLRRLDEAGFTLVIVSNQSGVGRGYFTREQARSFNEELIAQIALRGGPFINEIYMCYHIPQDKCGCRKPEPGMLLEAVSLLEVDIADCYMIGDNGIDLVAGMEAGCRKSYQATNNLDQIVTSILEDQ